MSWEPGVVNSTSFYPDVLTVEEWEERRTWGSGLVRAAVFADFAIFSSGRGPFCHVPSDLT